MKTARIIIAVALLVLITSLAPIAVEADGGFVLSIEPEELEWGQSVQLEGTYWPEGDVEISARFLNERFQPDGADIPPVPPGDFSFDTLLRFEEVAGLPDRPTPGWVEITVHVGRIEMHRSLVVIADGGRPPDAGYVSGRIDHGQLSMSGIYVVWAPADEQGAYAFNWSDGNDYHTDYLGPGEWFVGLYDLQGKAHAIGGDVFAITAYSNELGSDVTLTGRLVTVRPGEPLGGVNFTLAEGPAPAAEATRISPAATPTSPASAVGSARDASGSSGWLALALLGVGGGFLVAAAGTVRWVARRRR